MKTKRRIYAVNYSFVCEFCEELIAGNVPFRECTIHPETRMVSQKDICTDCVNKINPREVSLWK